MKKIMPLAGIVLSLWGCAGSPEVSEQSSQVPDRPVYQISIEKGKEVTLSLGTEKKPGVDAFFDAVAISVKPGEKAQFVVGDNLAGYFEGYTQDYRKGEGYLMKNTTLFKNYASFADGRLNNRASAATGEDVLPYGHRVRYPDGSWEEMALLSGQYALSIAAHSDKPRALGLLPLLKLSQEATAVEQRGSVILLSPKNPPANALYPPYAAIGADRSFTFSSGLKQAPGEAEQILKLSAHELAVYVAALEPSTDLTVTLAFGFTAEEAVKKATELSVSDPLKAEKQASYDELTQSLIWTDDPLYNQALTWAKAAAHLFVVKEFGKGIWAGLPWFKNNWGRDTFISLPGTLLVSGSFDEAREVLDNFARFQNLGAAELSVAVPTEAEATAVRAWLKTRTGPKMLRANNAFTVRLPAEYAGGPLGTALLADLAAAFPQLKAEIRFVKDKSYGRIPNLVNSLEDIIYNTTDGTPWMIREVFEYLRYTGDKEFAQKLYPVIKTALDGAIDSYVDGEGFLTHDDADTWMDARISGKLPWSARGSRAVEIQTLWYTALQVGIFFAREAKDIASADRWTQKADLLKAHFTEKFWDGNRMADRLRADGSPDFKVRPNQLMAVSVPFDKRLTAPEVEAAVVRNAVSELLYPYGIASLSQNDPYFHPIHENIKYHHKDAAYHNGTVWGWNAGFAVTAMSRFGYQDLAYELARNLGDQILHLGTRGNMSELLNALPDEKGQIKPSGTYAQAWSVAEYARNGYQDFVGFRPDLLEGTLAFYPSLPSAWRSVYAVLPFGRGESVEVTVAKEATGEKWTFALRGQGPRRISLEMLNPDKSRAKVGLTVSPGTEAVVEWKAGQVLVNGKIVQASATLASYADLIGDLKFQTPKSYRPEDFPVLKDKNVLKGIIERGEYR